MGLGVSRVQRFGSAVSGSGFNRNAYTQNPKPYTLNPKPYTLHPKPYTLHASNLKGAQPGLRSTAQRTALERFGPQPPWTSGGQGFRV